MSWELISLSKVMQLQFNFVDLFILIILSDNWSIVKFKGLEDICKLHIDSEIMHDITIPARASEYTSAFK